MSDSDFQIYKGGFIIGMVCSSLTSLAMWIVFIYFSQ